MTAVVDNPQEPLSTARAAAPLCAHPDRTFVPLLSSFWWGEQCPAAANYTNYSYFLRAGPAWLNKSSYWWNYFGMTVANGSAICQSMTVCLYSLCTCYGDNVLQQLAWRNKASRSLQLCWNPHTRHKPAYLLLFCSFYVSIHIEQSYL